MLCRFTNFTQARLANISLYIICIMLGGKLATPLLAFLWPIKHFVVFLEHIRK